MATNHHNGGTTYERRDTNNRALAYFALVLILTVAAAMVFARYVLVYFEKTQPLGPAAAPFESPQTQTLPPLPRLQVKPAEDLAQYKYDQEKILETYGWIDKQTGVVRIPVDRAMDILLQRGLPARQTPPPPETPIPSGEISTPTLDPAAQLPAPAAAVSAKQ